MDPNLGIIKECILQMLPDATIYLFGSRAKGTNKVNSDYDICIVTPYVITVDWKMKHYSILQQNIVKRVQIVCDLHFCDQQKFDLNINDESTIAHWVINHGIKL